MDIQKYQTHWNATPIELAKQVLQEPKTTFMAEMKRPDGTSRVVLYSTKCGFFQKLRLLVERVRSCLTEMAKSLWTMQKRDVWEAFSDDVSVTSGKSLSDIETQKSICAIFDKALALSSVFKDEEKESIIRAKAELILDKISSSAGDVFVRELKKRTSSSYCPDDYHRLFNFLRVEVQTDDKDHPKKEVLLCDPAKTAELLEISNPTGDSSLSEEDQSLYEDRRRLIDDENRRRNRQYVSSMVDVLKEFPLRGDVLDELSLASNSHTVASALSSHPEQLPFSLEMFLGCTSQMAIGCFIGAPDLQPIIGSRGWLGFTADREMGERSYDLVVSKKNGQLVQMQIQNKVDMFMLIKVESGEVEKIPFGPLVLNSTVRPTQDGKGTELHLEAHFDEKAVPSENADLEFFASQCRKKYRMDKSYRIEVPLDAVPATSSSPHLLYFDNIP